MSKKFAIDWNSKKKAITEQDSKKDFKDVRLFTPDFNDKGTSETIIRFLPSKDTDIPYAKQYNHSFKNSKGKWFIENCPTSIKTSDNDIKCPVCEYNGEHWEGYSKTEQQRKRKLSYYSNIYIVKDPLHPENNGKVFLYRYGKKIHDKIMERFTPPEGSTLDPVNVWDWYEGLDFRLSIKKIETEKGKFDNNYDSATFKDTPTAIGDDDLIESIIAKLYSIKDFYNPDKFSSYSKMKERFDIAIGNITTKSQEARRVDPEQQEESNTDVAEDDIVEDVEDVFAQIKDE
jgi:hypothetical protein